MKKTLKIVLILLSIPAVLFAVAAAVLASIDLNDYRGEIEQLVADNTGRQLTVSGDLKKSFFPWLGVKVESVAMSNATGFKPATFAAVEKLEIKIDTLSLLYLKPRINRIVVKGLELHLSRNSRGENSWDDLSMADSSTTDKQSQTRAEDVKDDGDTVSDGSGEDMLASLRIEGLTIDNANVFWVDDQAGASYSVTGVNLNLDEVALNKPLSLQLGFEIASTAPKINAKIGLASQKIEWDLKNQRYGAKPLSIDIDARGDGLPVSPLVAHIQLTADADLNGQTLSVRDLQMEALGASINVQATVTQLLEAPQYQSTIKLASLNPQDLMNALAIPLPVTADKNALTSLSVEMQVKGMPDQVQVSPMTLRLDDTIIHSDLLLKHFSKPAINASVKLDKIDLDRYLPPVVEGAPSETQAPAPKADGTELAAQPLPIPVELIRSLDVSASVDAKKLIVRKLDIDDVNLKVRVKDSVATISPAMFKISKGSIRSDVTLDVKTSTPRYKVNQVINKVEAGPMAKAFAGDDHVSGLLDFKASISSQGAYVKEITENLNGNLSFQFENGAVKGFNLGEMIRKAKARLDKEEFVPSEVPKQTDFAELLGSATINKGIVHNKDLSAKSPLLRVEGKGKVNLVAENLNYLVTTYLVGSSKGQGGKSIDELKGIPIPIQLTGPFNDIQWDYKWSIIRKAFQDKYKKKAKKKVEAKKQELKKELDVKKDETKEELKEKAKEKLKKLFKF